MRTIREEDSAAAKFFSDLGKHKKRKKKEKKTSTATQSVITSTKSVSKTPKATDLYQPHTLDKEGKPTRDLTFNYDRSIFGSYRDKDYVDLRKSLTLEQTPKPNTITSTTILGATTITKVTKSGEKRFPVSKTSGEVIKGRSNVDHRVPLLWLAEILHPVSKYASESEKKLRTPRKGRKRPSAIELSNIHVDPKNTQLLSEAENIAKGAKLLSEYTKKSGWGTEITPQLLEPKKQAIAYHDYLVSVAEQFGTRGAMKRSDAQAYQEITGLVADPILDAGYRTQYSNPVFPPRNLTGFSAAEEARKAKAAAKKVASDKAWAEYSGEKPTESPRPKFQKGKTLKEIELEKEHGKQNRLRGMGILQSKPKSSIRQLASDQSTPKSVVTAQFSNQKPQASSGKTVEEQKDYDISPGGQWRREKGGKGEWQKIQKKTIVKKKKSYLEEMFPGINAPKLVKNRKGVLVTPRVRDTEKKRRAKAAKDLIINENWM